MTRAQQKAEEGLHDQTNLLQGSALIFTFCVLAFGLLFCFIDQNGLAVTLPQVGKDLDASDKISWAGTSNLIANTTFQVLYGRLSDLFGRKIVITSCFVLLSFSDLVCGFAVNSTMLFVFRGLAGVATGGVMSLGMMIVSDIVTLEQRGNYQGILGSMVGLGNIAGPLLAAAFTQRTTWRAFFWFLSPLAAISAVVDWLMLPNNMPKGNFRENLKKIDYLGVITGSSGMILLLIPISGGGTYFPWDSALVIGMLVAGGVMTMVFILIEWKVAELPMMPVYLWKNTPVAALLVQSFLMGIPFYAYVWFAPLYFQNVKGQSPIMSAVYTIPLVGAQAIASTCSGRYISKYKRYGEVLWAGFALFTLGGGLVCMWGRSTSIALIVIYFIIMGIGTGFVLQPMLVALQAHCTKAHRAIVISNRNVLRSSGGAVGLAMAAAVLQNALKSALPPELKYLGASAYTAPDVSRFTPADQNSILDAYSSASRAVWISLCPFPAACLLLCVLVKDRGLTRPDEKAQADAAAQQTKEGPDPEKGQSTNEIMVATSMDGDKKDHDLAEGHGSSEGSEKLARNSSQSGLAGQEKISTSNDASAAEASRSP
ncbi:putative MFS transporter [Viridothelium virens]|uniref:Putative MFS transporter n=1 Tax=Viridothelium virens TaxID=1048519 RepID=A0A6A6H3Z6_VIRVR|nr:putative MFS transporter [Viridothelium virens]